MILIESCTAKALNFSVCMGFWIKVDVSNTLATH